MVDAVRHVQLGHNPNAHTIVSLENQTETQRYLCNYSQLSTHGIHWPFRLRMHTAGRALLAP